MREAGVEPARLSALEPKSSASANSATLASFGHKQVYNNRDRQVKLKGIGVGYRSDLGVLLIS